MPTDHLFSRVGSEVWYARRENGTVVELRLDAAERHVRAGNLLKLRVERVVPGLQAAFLELNDAPNAYLHRDDLAPAPSSTPASPIEQRLSAGQSVVVRIEREPVGPKGPKVSGRASLPGRWLVYLPYEPICRLSRRIVDEAERTRLTELVQPAIGEDGGGFVVRTAAADADGAAVQREAESLAATWKRLKGSLDAVPTPGVVYAEPELPARMLRDATLGDGDRVICDHELDFAELVDWAERFVPELLDRLVRHDGTRTLWEDAELQDVLDRMMRPRVWLPSGGFLVIEETEAFVSVDVNTGRNLGRRDAEETVRRTNVEAAAEVARQLRLRDLGGVIVVDFIDMESERAREDVIEAMRAQLAEDPERTAIGRFSDLGLLELTRRRDRAHPRLLLTEPTHGWEGQGRRPNARWVAFRIFAEWDRAKRAGRSVERVRAHPEAIAWLERRRAEGGPSSVDLSEPSFVSESDWVPWRFRVEHA